MRAHVTRSALTCARESHPELPQCACAAAYHVTDNRPLALPPLLLREVVLVEQMVQSVQRVPERKIWVVDAAAVVTHVELRGSRGEGGATALAGGAAGAGLQLVVHACCATGSGGCSAPRSSKEEDDAEDM